MNDRELERMESEQVDLAKNRDVVYGVRRLPRKSKGGAGRFVNRSGFTKGVHSGKMTVSYMDGFSPKEKVEGSVGINELVIVLFKGKEVVALVEKFNESTFTVSMKDVDRKIPVRYDKFVARVNG